MRSDFLAGKRGLMCHYLFPLLFDAEGHPAEDLDRTVDSFDVPRFVGQVKESGSNHLIFTFGQNSGFYVAPNDVIDRYAGKGHCSRRDLVGDIMEEASARGIFFIGYLPCEIRSNISMHAPFGWTKRLDTPQKTFQKRYCEMIAFWAERYGKKLSGWWFDGCYPWRFFHNRHLETASWMAAARAGNPDAAISFNDGSYLEDSVAPVFREQDYLSGEANDLSDGWPVLGRSGRPFRFRKAYCPGTETLRHLLLPVDALWWHGNSEIPPTLHRFVPPKDPRRFAGVAFTQKELGSAVRRFCGAGAAVTFNVAVRADGLLAPGTIARLRRLGD